MDLIDADSWIHRSISEYRASGYTVVESGEGYDESALTALLKDKVSVLTGQSGAGKSSLLNRIEPSFHLHTQQTSKALGRGRHTTRHCELHPVAGGWWQTLPGFLRWISAICPSMRSLRASRIFSLIWASAASRTACI